MAAPGNGKTKAETAAKARSAEDEIGTDNSTSVSSKPSDITARIQTKAAELDDAMQATVVVAWELGGLLKEFKTQSGHGEYLPWLSKNLPHINPRTASSYMKLSDQHTRASIEKQPSVRAALSMTPSSYSNRKRVSDSATKRTATPADQEQQRVDDAEVLGQLLERHQDDPIVLGRFRSRLEAVEKRPRSKAAPVKGGPSESSGQSVTAEPEDVGEHGSEHDSAECWQTHIKNAVEKHGFELVKDFVLSLGAEQ